jgi:hypothetical protein
MKDEYIIVNKTTIESRIEHLEYALTLTLNLPKSYSIDFESQIFAIKEVLSKSTPLIPEIDAAIQFGKDVRGSNTFINTYDHNTPFIDYYDTTTETCQYISDLKLDI